MKRLVLAMMAAAALAGCQTFGSAALSPKPAVKMAAPTPTALAPPRIAAIETGVKAALKDPKSASFKTSSFQATTNSAGVTTACGYVRIKKPAADEPFIGTFSDSTFTVSALGDSPSGAQATIDSCQSAAISLQAPVSNVVPVPKRPKPVKAPAT